MHVRRADVLLRLGWNGSADAEQQDDAGYPSTGMIERSYDEDFVFDVLNHPSVYPWVCGDRDYAPIPVHGVLQDPKHVFLRAPGGGFMFFDRRDLHIQF